MQKYKFEYSWNRFGADASMRFLGMALRIRWKLRCFYPKNGTNSTIFHDELDLIQHFSAIFCDSSLVSVSYQDVRSTQFGYCILVYRRISERRRNDCGKTLNKRTFIMTTVEGAHRFRLHANKQNFMHSVYVL